MNIRRRGPRAPRWLLAAMLLATGLAAGAGTMAFADAGADVTYYACVNDSSGTLHIVAASQACATHESKIEWNQQGPAGPAGEPGASGANGVSKGYAAHTSFTRYTTDEQGQHSALQVASLTDLPGGDYMVTASETAVIEGLSDAGGVVSCALNPDGDVSGQTTTGTANIVVTDAVSVADGGTIALTCDGPPFALSSANAAITAVRVDTISSQSDTTPTTVLTARLIPSDPDHSQLCTLVVTGAALAPGSGVAASVNGGAAFAVTQLAGSPLAVFSDGTIAAETSFGYPGAEPSTLTLAGTAASGQPIESAPVAITGNCLATLSGHIVGPYTGSGFPGACALAVTGAGLLPGAVITASPNGYPSFPLGVLEGGSATVREDGTVQVNTIYGVSDIAVTLQAPSISGGLTVVAEPFTTTADCTPN
jgi:hypothetical protein